MPYLSQALCCNSTPGYNDQIELELAGYTKQYNDALSFGQVGKAGEVFKMIQTTQRKFYPCRCARAQSCLVISGRAHMQTMLWQKEPSHMLTRTRMTCMLAQTKRFAAQLQAPRPPPHIINSRLAGGMHAWVVVD